MQAIIADEESAFSSMLSRGIKELDQRVAKVKADGGKVVDGESAFFLYDTMGFPLDLTELMAKEAGLGVDEDGFAAAMAAQKARSAAAAAAAKGGDAALKLGAEQTAHLANAKVPFTDDSAKYCWEEPAAAATLQAIYTADGFVESVEAGEEGASVGLILDATAFYAEAGGQACDVGSILSSEGVEVEVTQVQTFGGFILAAPCARAR